MAAAAEEAGAESLWVSDHLVLLDQPTNDYPFTPDGAPSWDMTADYYESMTCCVAMAAATTTARVGTAVLILPQRNVIEIAKTAATVDRLSGGRLDLGVGAGWNQAEMEALQYDYRSRGKRFDEMLMALRDCWSGRPAAFRGETIEVPENTVLVPIPVQPNGVPMLVGGTSKPALRRAAELGDGWLSIAFTSTWDPDVQRVWIDDLEQRRGAHPSKPPRNVLKLHAGPDEVQVSLDLLDEVAEIGFDEVMIEPPFDHGLDEATALVREASARLRR